MNFTVLKNIAIAVKCIGQLHFSSHKHAQNFQIGNFHLWASSNSSLTMTVFCNHIFAFAPLLQQGITTIANFSFSFTKINQSTNAAMQKQCSMHEQQVVMAKMISPNVFDALSMSGCECHKIMCFCLEKLTLDTQQKLQTLKWFQNIFNAKF